MWSSDVDSKAAGGICPRLKGGCPFGKDWTSHGLKAHSGFFWWWRGGGVADVVTGTLWSTMTERFSQMEAILEQRRLDESLTRTGRGPATAAKLAAKARQDYGEDIAVPDEASLRKVLRA